MNPAHIFSSIKAFRSGSIARRKALYFSRISFFLRLISYIHYAGGGKVFRERPFLPPHPPPISKLYNYILIIAHERLRIKSHRCLNRRAEFHRLLVPAENRDELKPELERHSHSLSRNDIAVADDRLTGYLRAGKRILKAGETYRLTPVQVSSSHRVSTVPHI